MGNAKLARYLMKFATHPLLFLLRFLSYGMPRSKNVWAFGHPARFEGNSKYLFLEVENSQSKDVNALWISRNRRVLQELGHRGYRAAHAYSFKGVWHILRSKYFIVDTSVEVISYWLSGGAKVINLFHALPIKKMERDVEKGESAEVVLFHSQGVLQLLMRFLLPWRFVKPSYVASTSPLYTRIFSSMFRIPADRVRETGFPRNDILLKDIRGSDIGVDGDALAHIETWKKRGAKIVLYAPTFRDTGDSPFLEDLAAVEKLNKLMEKRNALFVLKLHPFIKVSMGEGTHSNILNAAPLTDSYPLLKLADVLVTDYSSIFVDFLLLDRPEIFFAYDLEKYMKRDRELYFDYHEFTPGPKARSFNEFLETMEAVLAGKDAFREQRARQQDRCFSRQDGESSARVRQFLRSL